MDKKPLQLEETGYFGAKDDVQERDYQLAGGGIALPKVRQTYFQKQTRYQQTEVSGVSCTVHAAMGAYTDQTGNVFDLPHRQAVWSIALSEGADPLVGWSVSKAVDVVRKYANTLWGLNMMSFRVDVGSPEFYQALDQGYSVVTGFNGSTAYEVDRRDGVLDGVVFGRTQYGHSVRVCKNTDGNFTLVVDNYPSTSKWNTYKIDRSHFDKLIENNVFFIGGYVYVFKEDWEKMNAQSNIPAWASKTVEKALSKKIIDHTDTLDLPLTVPEIETLLVDAGVFMQKQGSISLVRFLVALDRLGKL